MRDYIEEALAGIGLVLWAGTVSLVFGMLAS